MPLKTKIRWAECPEEPPRWTQGDNNALSLRKGKEKEEKTWQEEEKVGLLVKRETYLPIQNFMHE